MNFLDIQQEILDRLDFTSVTDTTRVGRAINRRYKEITSTIGLQTSRRVSVTQAVSIGVQTVTFTGIEKIINIRNSAGRILDEVPYEMIRDINPSTNDNTTKYAIERMDATSVTIRLNNLPQTAFNLFADGHENLDILNGTQVPAFPESFHDILIFGVCADEYRKLEKLSLAVDADRNFEKRLSELRFWVAKSAYLDHYQGKAKEGRFGSVSSSGSGSGAGVNGATSYTQTGNIHFDLDPASPFTVASGSAVVTNLDADTVDGIHGTALAELGENETVTGDWDFQNVDILGTLDVTGFTSIQDSLGVAGVLAVTNSATVGTTLAVTGATTVGSTLGVTGNTTVGGTLGVTGATSLAATTISTTLGVTGASTLAAVTATTGSFSSTLAVTGVPTFTEKVVANKGVQFPTVQVASADVNALDDYEEGTFTPTIGGSTGQSGQAYSLQAAEYVKIGKHVHVQGRVNLSTLGTITGDVQIQGLPFVPSAVSYSGVLIPYFANMTTPTIYISGLVVPTASNITLIHRASAGVSMGVLNQADLSNTTEFIFSANYIATA